MVIDQKKEKMIVPAGKLVNFVLSHRQGFTWGCLFCAVCDYGGSAVKLEEMIA